MTSKILVIAVHGTFAGEYNLDKNGKSAHEEWWHDDHIFAKTFKSDLESKQPDAIVKWKHFQWSGANKDKERLQAAKDLFVELQSHLTDSKYDRVILIGHSHGGSVINYMLDHHDDDLNVEVYTIGTPFSHLHGLWRPLLFINFVAFLVAVAGSLILIDPIAQLVELRPHENTDKWQSLHYWMLILPLYIAMLIGWRIVQRPMFRQYTNRIKGKIKNRYRIIYHPQDEAIAALSVIPERQYNFAFAIRLVSILIAIGLFLYLIGFFFDPMTVDCEPEQRAEECDYFKSINFMEKMRAIFFTGAVCFFVPVILQIFFGYLLKPFNRLLSKILNGFLYNNGLGNDSGRIKTMSAEPQLPSKTDFSRVRHSRLAPIFEKMVADTTQHLGATKTETLSAMSSGHDLFTALELNKGDLSKALVHCNYFTEDMAIVIVDDLLDSAKVRSTFDK